MSGCDWAHTNSLWVDAALQWTLSSKLWSRILSVDGDPASGAYRSLEWELEGDGVGGDFTLFSSGSYTATFSSQHAAMWTFDDTTLLFDNHLSTSGPDSRGITIDWSTGDADIVAEYLMEDSTGGHLNCLMGGAFIDVLPSETMFAFCPSHQQYYDPFFNEFDGINQVAWGMNAACPSGNGVRDSLSSYRGYPILW